MEQVQLWHCRPRRFDPRSALLRQQWIQGLSGRSPPELSRRPLPDRFADPQDDRFGSDQRSQSGGLTAPKNTAWILWGVQAVASALQRGKFAPLLQRTLDQPAWL